MNFYQFFRYWQQVAAKVAWPIVRHNTDIRQKILLQNSFSSSVTNGSVIPFSIGPARDSCAARPFFATQGTPQL
jgi:hypothetical protein